jgi:hypothetical protein
VICDCSKADAFDSDHIFECGRYEYIVDKPDIELDYMDGELVVAICRVCRDRYARRVHQTRARSLKRAQDYIGNMYMRND